MALVVEDGTGVVNANSYIDTTYFDSYWTDRGNSEAVAITDKEPLLIQATDFIESIYYNKWLGYRLTDIQVLEFPRVIDGVDVGVPDRLKKAVWELALKANSGTLLEDINQQIIKEKVSVIETTYSEFSDQLTRYTAVYNLISIYLENASQNSVKVTRV